MQSQVRMLRFSRWISCCISIVVALRSFLSDVEGYFRVHVYALAADTYTIKQYEYTTRELGEKRSEECRTKLCRAAPMFLFSAGF